jgi:phage terminase small subunit
MRNKIVTLLAVTLLALLATLGIWQRSNANPATSTRMTEQELNPQEATPAIPLPPTKRLTAKEITFCYKLLEGMSTKDAAIASGFKESIATQASRWIREDRDNSSKPHVWDYFQNILKKKLRLHDVTVDNILNELRIIAFSSLEHFIDLPTRAELMAEAQEAKALEYGSSPAAVDEWKKYRPGSYIKLKAMDDIPRQLIPAIQEITESKDGIRIKLHSKLDAIEKLAKYLAMYLDKDHKLDDDGPGVKEINLIVDGSKSPLMIAMRGGDQSKTA